MFGLYIFIIDKHAFHHYNIVLCNKYACILQDNCFANACLRYFRNDSNDVLTVVKHFTLTYQKSIMIMISLFAHIEKYFVSTTIIHLN